MPKLTLTLKKIDKISDKIRHNLARMIVRDSSEYTPYNEAQVYQTILERYHIVCLMLNINGMES